jgi:glutaredoxin
MDKLVVIYTMKTCPHCVDFKEKLDEADIDYVDRDIFEYEEEYDLFVNATGNDYVPAFMLIEDFESESPTTSLYAPDQDFDNIENGVKIIKEFYER